MTWDSEPCFLVHRPSLASALPAKPFDNFQMFPPSVTLLNVGHGLTWPHKHTACSTSEFSDLVSSRWRCPYRQQRALCSSDTFQPFKNNKTVNADTTNMMWLDTLWHNIHLKKQGRATGTDGSEDTGADQQALFPKFDPQNPHCTGEN